VKKAFVLDTNVLIHDPEAVYKFEENDVYIPIFVVEEIDKFKKESSERGRNSRQFCRLLDSLREKSKRPLSEGVLLGERGSIKLGKLYIYVPETHDHNVSLDHGAQDRAILNCAIKIRDSHERRKTIFITMDTNLRIRADAIGMASETYENSKNVIADEKTSVIRVGTSKEVIDTLFSKGSVEVQELPNNIRPNGSVILNNISSPNHTGLGRYDKENNVVRKLSYPKEGVKGIRPKNVEQSFAFDLLLDDDIQLVTLIGKAGTGKSQPISEPVVTPDGFIPMGEVVVGSYVIGSNGSPTKVLGVFPQGKLDVYKVSFSDGSSTKCSIDHLWNTKTNSERDRKLDYKTRTTKEILDTLKSNRKDNRKNHSIPTSLPVQFSEKEVDLDPYVMGLLLGDGCLRHHVGYSTSDFETIESIRSLIPSTTTVRFKSKYDWSFRRTQRNNKKHDIRTALEKYGLYGSYANNKFIPMPYLVNSIRNRVSLLQGLLDSDGTLDYTSGKGVSFTTVSPKLRDDIIFLVRSLGGISRYHEKLGVRHHDGMKTKGQMFFRVSISLPPEIEPFRISRKKSVYNNKVGKGNRSTTRYITDIELVGQEECQCILVDAKDSLYLTNDFIVTHNTLLAIAAGLERIEAGAYSKMLVSRPVMPLGRDIGFLPGSVEEKMAPWMQPIFDNLEFLFSQSKKFDKAEYDDLLAKGIIQVEPITYIRGRSLPYQYMVVDECQNMSPHEIKTVLSRAGEGAKVVLTGDPEQIDSPYVDSASNGLSYVMEKFRDQKIAGNVILTKGERSLLAELATQLL